MAIDQSSKVVLQAFVLDNADPQRLEAQLQQFNILEAIGAVRQELRYSDFLAFLLDPQQNHGLGDLVAKKLLQRALATVSETPLAVTPIDLDIWDLGKMEVIREWQSIDILLRDDVNKFVVAIKNKMDSGEHSGQLDRYGHTLQRSFHEWRKVCLYLTPDGENPSHKEFVAIDYGLITAGLEELVASPALKPSPEVRMY